MRGLIVRGHLEALGHDTGGLRAGVKLRVAGRSLRRAKAANQVSPSSNSCEMPPECHGTRETELKQRGTGEPVC